LVHALIRTERPQCPGQVLCVRSARDLIWRSPEGSLIAWRQPEYLDSFVVVGTHTDSPNLRGRTNPDVTSANFAQVGM
jgi:aspartyl aminopeptidase